MTEDEARERFLSLKANAPSSDERDISDNEAATRLRLIDPILFEVLGWSRDSARVEAPCGKGRADYAIRDREGRCWFLVEAKRCDGSLVPPGDVLRVEHLKITGPVLTDVWRIIDGQMTPYLGRFRPAYGVVTNGHQWIFFGHETLPPEAELADTHAAVFRSLDAIEAAFDKFWQFASAERVRVQHLTRFILPEFDRGVVRCERPTRVVPAGEERPVLYQDRARFYEDLERAMDLAFRPILDAPDALEQCFVESPQSRDADTHLHRLATELGKQLLDASTRYPDDVRSEVDEWRKGGDDPLPSSVELAGQGYIARLVGEHSSGKSVFLRRLFEAHLGELASHVAVIRIDCGKPPFSQEAASREAFKQLKARLFGDEGPTWEQFREIYRRDWQEYRRLLGLDDEAGHSEVRQKFIIEHRRREHDDPSAALYTFAEFAVRNRRWLPCLVLDNVDILTRPEEAVAWAIAFHRRCFSLTTVAIQDATLWELRRRRADHLADLDPEQYWLPRPRIRDVLEKRCSYLRELISSAPATRIALARTRLGKRGQYQWRVSADDLVKTVSAVLLDDQTVANWIGNLCNHDIGEVLQLCKQVLLSPHVRAEELLGSQVTQRRFQLRHVLKAIITPKHEQFQALPTDCVMNVFGHWSDRGWMPLLPARFLALLRVREDDARNRKDPLGGFASVEMLVETGEIYWGVPPEETRVCLERLRVVRLVETYDPGDCDLRSASARVRILPRGRQHLEWAVKEPTYVRLMGEVDLISDRKTADRLHDQWDAFLQAMKTEDGRTIGKAEHEFVRTYVVYVLEHARRSRAPSPSSAPSPAAEFEVDLDRAWA